MSERLRAPNPRHIFGMFVRILWPHTGRISEALATPISNPARKLRQAPESATSIAQNIAQSDVVARVRQVERAGAIRWRLGPGGG